MSSPYRYATLRAPRAVVGEPSVRRVRHGLRDQLVLMAFSAALSLGLAALLGVVLAAALQVGNQ